MNEKPIFRRRNYFIKKKFQIDFSIKFLILIVLEAVLAIGLFIYLSKGTLTTSYLGSDLKIAKTSEFFLPTLLLSNLVILGVTGIVGIVVMIFISHKIAGPLYRFEQTLADISNGNLTHRFNLRQDDQLIQLAESINKFTAGMDKMAGDMKYNAHEILKLFSELQSKMSSNNQLSNKELENQLLEASKKVQELKEAIDYFKTSKDKEIKG
ncbi:MAG: methyl-accepting chemotaxis protein [Nitrospinae bacterium]|nr:methyl-accepting chemotaxis protein [Nitrospinota bacterium]